MKWNRQAICILLLVVVAGAVAFAAVMNAGKTFALVGDMIGLFSPLIAGGVIAFALNVPMRFLERNMPQALRAKRLGRPLALVMTLALVVLVLLLAFAVIAPGVEEAAVSIAQQIPDAAERLQTQLELYSGYLPYFAQVAESLNIDWASLSQKVIQLIHSWGGGLLSTGGNLVGGVISAIATFVIGLVFSFYILLQKEKLSCHGKQVLYGLLPERAADRAVEVLRLSNQTFSRFLSGQCLEAVILGTLFVITMTVFRFPYALLIGVLIACTALIPIVGAFIGCGVGVLLIAVTDPWKALWFIVLFLVLQQLEGNLIYPHVVGNSIGLPSIWVLAAVTLGGSLFGIVGILLFIPLCSVLYALFRSFIRRRLRDRSVPEEKWRGVPEERE